MSGYRSYVPWNKNAPSSTTPSNNYAASKKDPSTCNLKYESPYSSKLRPDVKKTTVKVTPSDASTSTYQRLYGSRSELANRIKSAEVNPDFPRPYAAGSRERSDSLSSTASSTIPKYSGKTSTSTSRENSREDLLLAKYRPPESKKDMLSARFTSKEDVRTPTLKYKSNTTTSREDLTTKGAQKYITSRFLPKNTIEKSHTAYIRSSTSRTSEVSRKNRELLNTLSTNTDKTSSSRSLVNRCVSLVPEYGSRVSVPRESKVSPKVEVPVVAIETVSVVTRSTSPNPPPSPTQPSYVRTRRDTVARAIEKQISRPKCRGEMVDKSVQSDTSSKTSRYGGVSRITTPPWSGFLDLKYSSPGTGDADTKNLSRNNSSKSISTSSSKSELHQSRSNSSQSISETKLKAVSIKTNKLPPSDTPNKDFRKSVLNMNPETQKLGKTTKQSKSGKSSADSDTVNESDSKTKSGRSKSSSSERSLGSKSSDDETKIRSDGTSADELTKQRQSKSFLMRALAPVTNFFKNNNKQEGHSPTEVAASEDHVSDIPCLSPDTEWRQDVGPEFLQRYQIRHIDSGERAWWMGSNENLCTSSEITEFDSEIPLGDRASPEGLETPREEVEAGRFSPYDNVSVYQRSAELFISKHTNIDDILGGGSSQLLSPLINRIFSYQPPSATDEVDVSQVQVRSRETGGNEFGQHWLDDAALQLYKDGDYGSYLDLDASISEQQEEFEGFHTNKKNSIVLRTQLSVRVHTIIEKLLTSEGRELRRALFSLKQIFQEDKDLVHEFVQNDGLACLIKVGSEADQNYQNYILRALGQVMLYVDGMNGVMEHNATVQWLYALISSRFRLVVKTALKLLLVFVEYTDGNCMLLIRAVHAVDAHSLPWSNVMTLLLDFDAADTELLIYATTLINKCLGGVPDQDTYYDQTDALEEQGIAAIIERYMAKPGTDLDLLQQFHIYEAVLKYEDGEEDTTTASIKHLDEAMRSTLRSRKSLVGSAERRKSRRHSTGNTPLHHPNAVIRKLPLKENNAADDDGESSSSSSQSSNGVRNHVELNGSYNKTNKGETNDAGVTPALRRRLERAERQRSFMKEQQENAHLIRGVISKADEIHTNGGCYNNGIQERTRNARNVYNKFDPDEAKQPWIMDDLETTAATPENEHERKQLPSVLKLKKENTVKDLTQKLASQNIIMHGPVVPEDNNNKQRIEGMTGLISKAKEGLTKSKSQASVKSPTGEVCGGQGKAPPPPVPIGETRKSENELRWDEMVANMRRPLNLCDMDFTDLTPDEEVDVLAPVSVANGIPPPPPPPRVCLPPPPVPGPPLFAARSRTTPDTKIPVVKKNKKTVKLFWREVRDDPISIMKLKTGYIWDELNPVMVDTQKLEHLFESRAKDLISKKQQETNKNKEIIVLDPKRSNAINIGMTKLPPPRSIKTAILKMDATIMNREGIEKLLTMLPTEEERSKIQEAQTTSPDVPLGSAEQFLLTLASISELPARLRLWAFKLDFENVEREIAEPLMDLKQGLQVLRSNKTFRGILSTLLSIGNFLNGNEVKGFQIEYLAKVPEVKDTVHKHSLLHHLCHIVMEKFPDASDLYSEIGAVTRASKIDFDELAQNIVKLETDCKASWDHLKLIAKHDGATMKQKMSEFLADCAERIILLGMIHRRVINRCHRFLLWLGVPLSQIADTKPSEFCRIVSEFALEYRTTRERVLQQLEKKANHRERNKTRGKMITETPKFRSKEDRADAELRQLLGSDYSDVESLQGTLPWSRRHKKDANRSLMGTINGHLTDGDDEILESLVKTATKTPSTRPAPRERKRTRHADRKSLRRTLKNGLTEEEKLHLAAYIKGYSFAG